MKIKTILKLFCKDCHLIKRKNCICAHFIRFKKHLEEYEAEKKPKIILCPNCMYAFPPKDPLEKHSHLPTKTEGIGITNKKENNDKLGLKILVQLEIGYGNVSEWNYQTSYVHLLKKIKTYFENDITIPETLKLKFKHLDKVRISEIIQ